MRITTAAFTSNVSGVVRIHPQAVLEQAGILNATGSPINGIDVAAGNLTQQRSWMKGLPYVIRSGEVSFTGGGLTMLPGAVVKLKGIGATLGALRFSGGTFNVAGTEAEPVVFTSLLDDAFGGDTNNDGSATMPAKSDWHGIRLLTVSAVSSIDHVIARYSGAGNIGTFDLSNSTATISNSDLTQGGLAGAHVNSGASLTVLNSDVKNNFDGVRASNSKVTILNSSLSGNTSRGVNVVSASLGPVQAAYNWWGSPSGPAHAGNPGGAGDSVTDNVNYVPFQGSEPSNVLPTVVSVTLLDPTPARPGVTVRLRAFFNKDMNPQTLPTATYGQASPYTDYAVMAGTWTSNSTYEASATIPAEAADGAYTLRLAGAADFAGNQISPSESAYYTVDGTPPGAPAMTSAFSLAGGTVALSWQAPAGEAAADYRLYRSTEDFNSVSTMTPVRVGIGTTSASDLPPEDGSYYYAVTARDAAGNEGPVSDRLVGVSLRAPTSPPEDLAALADLPGSRILLSWGPPSTGTAASYSVFRSSWAFPATAGLTALRAGVTTTLIADDLTADGTYFYRVEALDAIGNRSDSAGPVSALFDVHPPVITFAGVTAGQHSRFDLLPAAVIADFSAVVSTMTLNGEPFISSTTIYQALNQTVSEGGTASLTCSEGTIRSFSSVWATSCGNPKNCGTCAIGGTSCNVVYNNSLCGDVAPGCSKDGRLAIDCGYTTTLTEPGTYFLAVQAQDVFLHASSASVSFAIDKTAPSIAVTFPADGALLNANATVAYSLFDDFTATGSLIVRNGANQPPPFVFTSEGLNAVSLTATDLAGNVGTATSTFTLDKTAPTGVTDLRIGDVRVGELDLLWTAPSDALSGVAGYLVRLATYPITAGNFLALPASQAPAVQSSGTAILQTVTADTAKTLYFAVRSTDAAGNLSPLSNPVFLDTDPPLITSVSPPLGATVSRPTRITVSATDLSGVASVVFAIDGVAVATRTAAPYEYDWATIPLADGEHTVELRATDAAGNSVVLPGFYTLHYAPPASPVVTSPASGFSTFVATVTVTGSVEPGTTAQVRVNGVPSGSAYAPSGSFSAQAVLPVEGDYQITVVATDAKGQSSPSASRTVFYNLAPPNPPAGFSAETRAAGKIHLSWDVPGGKAPVSYRLYRSPSAVALSPGVTPGAGLRIASGLTATELDDTPASDGVYYYGGTSLDSSGNESALSEVSSALSDRAAPSAAIALGTGTVGPGAHPLTLTLTKPLASVPILLFVANGAGPSAVSLSASSPTVWTGTLTVTGATPYGPAVFQFQGTDFAGNAGTTITSGRTLFVDNRGPVGAVTLYPFPPLKAGEADLALVLDEPVVSTPSLTFVTAAGTTVTVALEGAGTTWVSTFAVPSGADGTAVFHYSAADALGNAGTTLSSGGSFAIDTTPTGPPLSLGAVSRPAGVIRLSWSGPIGEAAAAYRVYRDSAALPGTVAPSGDQTGHLDDLPPAEGAYTYETSSFDAAGNESARSNPAGALSDATLPSAPAGSTATINAFGRAEVSWSTVAGETYRVRRATYAAASYALAPFVVVSPPYVDTPPQNGLIYYAIEALDAAGNVSASASVATVFFDRAPPVISVTGVAEGGLYNAPVFPVYSASDPALDEGSVAALLNGASFVSGSAVSGEGDYTLQVTAANLAAISSTVTVHFTLDRSSPAISVAGVVSGQAYQQAVIPVVAVTDPRLGAVVLTLNGAAYAAGTPVSADGAYSLVVTARDLAGNVASSTTTFTLDLPPSAPPGFSVAIEEGLGATLTWQNPAADVAGYRVYRDGVPLHQGLLSQALLSDPAFVLGSARLYEVAAVDAAGQEGARAKATIPAATVVLESFGSVDGGAAYLTRGFFDSVRVRLANSSASSKLLGPTSLTILSNGVPSTSGSAPSVTVPAGGQLTSEGVLITPLSLSGAAAVRATVSLPVEPGASATMRRTFPVAARDPREPILEVFSGALVRGANANVQVKVNNQGSAPLQVLSAVPSDLLVELRTPEGTVLSTSRLSQTGNGAAASPSGWFVAVPGGSSVMLDPVAVFVPDSVGVTAQIRARVDRVFTNLVSGGVQGPRSFETVKTLSGVSAPPYRAAVRAQQPLYDQASTILLVGEALDQEDGLVPGATVQIGVSLRGFERLASTRTDETGHYQLTFAPAPSEAGAYTLWAAHPSVVDRAPQSSFTVVGLAFQFSDFTTRLTQNSATPFRVNLTNSGQTRIEGLSASVISSAVLSGASLTLDAASLPAALDAGQSASLSFTGSATGASALGRSRFAVRVTESHGFIRELPVNVDVAAALPVPSAVPQAFNVGVRAGQVRRLETRLKNLGNRDWQGVTLSAPALSWARIDGPTSLGDIPPGGEKLVAIVLEPPTGLPSQAYASNPLVTVSALNAASVPLNTLITVTASGQGNVAYTVIDADKPRNAFGVGVSIPGAEATLVSLDVAGLSFRATADSNGLARVLSVPQGRYSYTVRASGYEDRTGTELIEPGVTLAKEIILPTNVITYEWTVEPTTIQDKYDITLGITFKTDVPAPVVSVEPAVLNFALEGGQSADAQLTFENKGLITATNVRVRPNIIDPAVTVDFPFDTIPELRPGQKVTVPFRIGLIHASCHPLDIGVDYRYIAACGIEAEKALPTVKITAGTCFNLPTVGVGGGSGGGFSSTPQTSGGGSGISLSVPASYISFAMPQPPPPSGGAQVCRSPKIKYPSECNNCDQIGSYSNPGGDPRVPESDLSLSVPKFGGSLDFTRVYDSEDFDVTALGKGWTHSFAARVSMFPVGVIYFPRRDLLNTASVEFTSTGGALMRADAGVGPFGIKAEDYAELRTPSGRRLLFRHTGNGQFAAPVGEPSTLVLDTATASGYTWTMPDKTVYRFSAGGRLDTIQDRNGNTVTLGYDGSGLTTVRDPDNRVLYTLANSGGKLQSVTDLAGRVVTYGYNGQGQLSSASGPKGNTSYGYSSYEIPDLDANGFANGIFGAYNSVSLMTSVTSPNGHVTSFTYGPANKVVDYPQMPMFQAVQASGGGTGSFAVGDAGFGAAPITIGRATPPADKAYFTALIPIGSSYVVNTDRFAQWFFSQRLLTLSENGPLGNYSFSHTIDELIEGGKTIVTGPLGSSETRTWENLGGRTHSTDVIDAAGGFTKVVYDGNRNPAQITDRAGRTTTVVYDSKNNPTRITDALGFSKTLVYEPAHNRLTQISDAKANQEKFFYDTEGNLIRGENAISNAVTINYDASGLAIAITDPHNKSVIIGRNAAGYATNITDALNHTSQITYDPMGRVSRILDSANRPTDFEYDSDGNVTRVNDALNGSARFDYVSGSLASGRLLDRQYDAKNQVTDYEYDARGRLTSIVNALNQSRSLRYNDANEITQVTKPDGTTVDFEYDSLGRLTRKSIPGDPVVYEYDSTGNLSKAEDGDSVVQINYDPLSRPTRVIQTNKTSNLSSQIDYEYDPNGNRTRMVLAANPISLAWSYVYDSLNRLTSITNPQNQTFAFEYDSLNRRTRLVYPNGIETLYSYDGVGHILSIVNRRQIDLVVTSSSVYTYDSTGNRLTMRDYAGTHAYGYDALHRLTGVDHPSTSGLPALSEAFSYDSVGNRLADAQKNGYSYDQANRLLADSKFTYVHDSNGNLISKTNQITAEQWQYSFDHSNQLTGVDSPQGTILYKYDALGRKIERVVSRGTETVTTRYIYDALDVLGVASGTNQLTDIVTHGPVFDEHLSIFTLAAGSETFWHSGALNSIEAITDGDGTVVARVDYLAFGKPHITEHQSGAYPRHLPYAQFGAEYDADAGLYHMRARYYQPDEGRFISEDPVFPFVRGDNAYIAMNNSPINRIDPLGFLTDSENRRMQKFQNQVALPANAISVVGAIGIISLAPIAGPAVGVLGAYIFVRGLAGVVLSAKNLYIGEQTGEYGPNSLLGCVANQAFPNNQNAQNGAAIVDLSIDLATGATALKAMGAIRTWKNVQVMGDFGPTGTAKNLEKWSNPGVVGAVTSAADMTTTVTTAIIQSASPINKQPLRNK
ncbi:MAG: RHS repeat-associated core domain-containing protein [Elusimicrobiota bacterium]|nr:RHS repeat-associated core domain-containing protein [Elusimicrobiota bacterium]